MKSETGKAGTPRMSTLVSVSFLVHGRVQGVFFRRYACQEATSLGLVGHVRNVRGTGAVSGVLQGPAPSVARMKAWLETTGSPQSRIDRVEFSEEREIPRLEFDSFEIRPTSSV